MREYVEADIDVVIFEGAIAEVITESMMLCTHMPCRGEDQEPMLQLD